MSTVTRTVALTPELMTKIEEYAASQNITVNKAMFRALKHFFSEGAEA